LISGNTGSLTKAGTGTLILGGNNGFTGNVNINEGTVQLSGPTATIGASQAAATVLNLRQSSTLDLNGAGTSTLLYGTGSPAVASVTIGALNGAGTITNSGAGANTASALILGNGTTTTGTGTFAGILQDGAGKLS